VTAVVTAAIQTWIAWDGAIVTSAGWLPTGLRFGFGAMAGDAAKSFFKRRLAIEPGRPWIPFDQLDFAIGALLLADPLAGLGWSDIVVILLVTFAGDIAVNRIAYALGVRETPW
jgi:CDP-2,3-bis-(O-geranylgeranyl)-sn-glycerol synthase